MQLHPPRSPCRSKVSVPYNQSFDDTPSVAESEVSSIDYNLDDDSVTKLGDGVEPRIPLQWNFKGLTIWLEFEEKENDLTKALEEASQFYGTDRVPNPHATAIYGMVHLSEEHAMEKLEEVARAFPSGWPCVMDRPISVKQDLAVEGRPGEVCSISWAELTLKTNEQHELAIDKLYEIFEVPEQRTGPWSPHISLAYDNPEDSVLNLTDTISYVAQNPTLMEGRRIQAVSLWSTEGKLAQWRDRKSVV